jgi:hypothetical protein
MPTSILGLLSPALPSAQSSSPVKEGTSDIFANADYTPILSNWYTAKPYGFKFTARSGKATMMFLPIGPSNLTISTHFATNVTPTLYGTVEEHSPVRYYDISIEGTTGFGPKYVQPFSASEEPQASLGRSSFTVKQGLNNIAGGLFNRTINTAQSIVTGINELYKGIPPASTGLQLDKTGYAAFHNLYRFFLEYKKDAAGVSDAKYTPRTTDKNGNDVHPLVFFNYKDNNQYKVIVNNFTLKRDKEDPMLYYYSISLRGYDLMDAGAPARINTNDSTAQTLKNLGLDGVQGSSYLTQMKELAQQGRGILSSIGAGINQLER